MQPRILTNTENRQDRSWESLWISLLLALFTLGLFWPILSQGFLHYDDPQYVRENEPVRQGLTWTSFVWSLTSEVQGNWHPVTMWTHMADCEWYGLEHPGGHHRTSLVLHVANVLLLFWFLRTSTGNMLAAAFVAALFAWHPTRVESVAWVAERKDVLSTFFWFAMLLAYVHYTRRPSWLRYMAVFVLLALGLMSKAMLVTAPCLLILLDIWPLARLPLRTSWRLTAAQLAVLVLEKIPLGALAAVSAVITYRVQRAGGAVLSWQRLDFSERLINVCDAYGNYLFNLVWPTRLAIMYPLPLEIHIRGWTIFSAMLCLVISGLALRWIRKRPYFFVGWFWFLGTLVPVIGLVQVGAQSMADRYTYVPLIGLFVIVAWGCNELLMRYSARRYRQSAAVAAIVVLALFAALCLRQVSFWRDELTLYSRAIEVTKDNYLAHYNYGNALINVGRLDEAREQCETTLALKPRHGSSHANLGRILVMQGRCTEALPSLLRAIEYSEDDARIWYELAFCEHRLNMLEAASVHYQQAIQRNDNLRHLYIEFGNVMARLGDTPAALGIYHTAQKRWPGSPTVAACLIWLYSTHAEDRFRNVEQAVSLAEAVREATDRRGKASIKIEDSLAAAFAAAGRFDEAIVLATRAYSMAREKRIYMEERGWEEGAQRAAIVEQKIAARIELYEAHQAFRQNPIDAPY